MKKFPDKDELALFQQFEEDGYVEHICYDCGVECLASEIDSPKAFCENCQEHKEFKPVI